MRRLSIGWYEVTTEICMYFHRSEKQIKLALSTRLSVAFSQIYYFASVCIRRLLIWNNPTGTCYIEIIRYIFRPRYISVNATVKKYTGVWPYCSLYKRDSIDHKPNSEQDSCWHIIRIQLFPSIEAWTKRPIFCDVFKYISWTKFSVFEKKLVPNFPIDKWPL